MEALKEGIGNAFTGTSNVLLAMDSDAADYRVFNVGTGRQLGILEMADILCRQVGPPGLRPEVVGKYRRGDIRQCHADIAALSALGYRPRVGFEDGVLELVEWVRRQPAEDLTEQAAAELRKRGLVR